MIFSHTTNTIPGMYTPALYMARLKIEVLSIYVRNNIRLSAILQTMKLEDP